MPTPAEPYRFAGAYEGVAFRVRPSRQSEDRRLKAAVRRAEQTRNIEASRQRRRKLEASAGCIVPDGVKVESDA